MIYSEKGSHIYHQLINQLQKILKLEQQRDYSDKAVINGLDKYLANWVAKLKKYVSTKQLYQIKELGLTNPNYTVQTKQQRQQWIHQIQKWLINTETTKSINNNDLPKKQVQRTAYTKQTQKPLNQSSLDSSIIHLKGISTTLASKFHKLGITTIRDLLYFFPHRHIDYSYPKSISQLTIGKEQTIVANIWQAQEIRLGGRRSTEAIVGDDTGNIRVVWFNNPYLIKALTTNKQVVLSGRIGIFKNRLVFESPEWELLDDKELIHTARLVPVYSLTQGLRPRQIRKIIKNTLDKYLYEIQDFLPTEIKSRCQLLELHEAINQAHFPENQDLKDKARVRLAFDELFLLQLSVLGKKRDWQDKQPGKSLDTNLPVLKTFIESLPFKLTEAQLKSLNEILSDLKRSRPMSRLLQGEVGSGKTVVATAALLTTAANNYQGAFMAPTEILSEQHFSTICQLFSQISNEQIEDKYVRTYTGLLPKPLSIALLTGDTNQTKKQQIQQSLNEGEINIIIGTHALIQKNIHFHQLGLAVIDEQHRFGVTQRATLRQKGFNPHLLVMTATPIPRTLALTLFGDLDISIINQLPPGRPVIQTRWLRPSQREIAYEFIRRQITNNCQAFIICPLIEESEIIQAKAAAVEYDRLSREVFPNLKLGLLHGRMSSTEKDKVMRRFRSGKLDILVSTPVVEVGIDIPNATVMLVESADRFGLSQLHQFRGRIGRGNKPSYCMFLAQNPSEIARQRLDIIEKTRDGFLLAEEDLKLRGPGEFFGTRQSGLPDLRMAKLSDIELLELARGEAISLFKTDPDLKQPEHSPLARATTVIWQRGTELS